MRPFDSTIDIRPRQPGNEFQVLALRDRNFELSGAAAKMLCKVWRATAGGTILKKAVNAEDLQSFLTKDMFL